MAIHWRNNHEEFWIKIVNEYPSSSRKPLLFLIPFTRSYLREIGFSSMLVVKNKIRNKPNVDLPNLRVQLSTTPSTDIPSPTSNLKVLRSHWNGFPLFGLVVHFRRRRLFVEEIQLWCHHVKTAKKCYHKTLIERKNHVVRLNQLVHN